jgi:eukaryotic-like serine/threonine-protein kinase
MLPPSSNGNDDRPRAVGGAAARLRALFDAALEQPAPRRAAWVAAQSADDDERAALQRLLEADTVASGPLDTPVAERAARIGDDDDAGSEGLIGQRIGAFRLIRLLGQGGMATVFLGEREGVDFTQQVAVKLLRRGLYSEVEQRLFRRERRTLALLSHPNIARLIDGGVTAAGIPYLVMDYVDGVPITHHAVERQLDLRARLHLFVVVCRAAAAAHRQLIVHRDIKPSNILVTPDGEVKLLDFGIAKLLEEDDGATVGGMTALTPDYAAPEQYGGGPISTATDVYALGVLLHELLLGARPARGAPRRPSSFVTDLSADSPHLAAPRLALRAALKGDLDNILLCALAAEPERRYASAGALADDIERHLQARPVSAHPPSSWYRTRKFARRHRGGVALTAVFALGLLASTGLALWQAQVAHRESLRAQQQAQAALTEARRAEAVRDLLVQLFENEEPGPARSALPDTATLLRRGAHRAQTELAAMPAVQVDMLMLIGRIFDRLSDYAQARTLLEQAVDAARRLPPDQRAGLGEALSQLGQLELSLKRYPEARRRFDEALAIQRRFDSRGLGTAMTLHRRALVYSETDQHALALADYRAALSLREAQLPDDHPLLVNSYGALGTAYGRAHRPQEAEGWQRRALALARRVHGDAHEETARRLNNLGVTLLELGQHGEAERLFAEAVAIDRRVFAGPNADAAPRQYNLGALRLRLGQLAAAERHLREAMNIGTTLGLEQSPGYGFALHQMARLHEVRGDHAQALALARRAALVLDAVLPPDHSRRLDADLQIARMELGTGDVATIDRRIEDLRRRLPTSDPALQASARYVHALALAADGRDAAAERELSAATASTSRLPTLRHDPVAWFAELAAVRLRRHDPAGARQSLREGLALADRMQLPPRHYLRAQLLLALAELEHDHDQLAAARHNAVAALDAMGDELPQAHPWRLQALALAGARPKS